MTSPHLTPPHPTSPHLASPHLLQGGKQQSGTGAWKVSQRVAPLFETLADLDNAGKVMRRLFNVRWYREELRYCPSATPPLLSCVRFWCWAQALISFGIPVSSLRVLATVATGWNAVNAVTSRVVDGRLQNWQHFVPIDHTNCCQS